VSTPVAWDEVEAVLSSGDPRPLTFLADDALRRLEDGDPFAPVATVVQRLPGSAGGSP
jgi:DNA primase